MPCGILDRAVAFSTIHIQPTKKKSVLGFAASQLLAVRRQSYASIDLTQHVSRVYRLARCDGRDTKQHNRAATADEKDENQVQRSSTTSGGNPSQAPSVESVAYKRTLYDTSAVGGYIASTFCRGTGAALSPSSPFSLTVRRRWVIVRT